MQKEVNGCIAYDRKDQTICLSYRLLLFLKPANHSLQTNPSTQKNAVLFFLSNHPQRETLYKQIFGLSTDQHGR